MQVFNTNDVFSWEQYASVKLQQIWRIHPLRMPVGMCVTILTQVVNSWNMVNKSKLSINNWFVVFNTLGIDCGSGIWSAGNLPLVFRMFNVINVNTKYCVKRIFFKWENFQWQSFGYCKQVLCLLHKYNQLILFALCCALFDNEI